MIRACENHWFPVRPTRKTLISEVDTLGGYRLTSHKCKCLVMGDTTDVVLPFVDVDPELKEDPSNVEWVWRFGVFGTCWNYTIDTKSSDINFNWNIYTGLRHKTCNNQCQYEWFGKLSLRYRILNVWTTCGKHCIYCVHSMVSLMESNLLTRPCLLIIRASCLFLEVRRQDGLAYVS